MGRIWVETHVVSTNLDFEWYAKKLLGKVYFDMEF